jgi:hypothetical protein
MKLYLISQTKNKDYDTYDSAEAVTVEYIGEAAEGIEVGIVCASFNVG